MTSNSWRSRGSRVRSDPVENLHSYVMVHGGLDRGERLSDVEWVRDVVTAAREVARQSPRWSGCAPDLTESLDILKGVLNR